MKDLFALYQYIKENYDNYHAINYTETQIIVDFHRGFEMKIQLQDFYNIYFNNIFYYDVDWQDIKDTINDFLTNQYVFCERNKKLRIIKLKDFHESTNYDHIWTIEKTLK